jgi:D-glycero-D-manno-heptose 1,7-bisphosphate phosphatase
LTRAAFLDRDGVLVKEILLAGEAHAALRLDDFEVVPEAGEQVRRLQRAGLRCVVFTNQPQIARGGLTMDTLTQMHTRLCAAVGVDDVVVCAHDDSDACTCRKPKPGMLLEAALRHDLSLEDSFVIGDRWRDIDAGHAAGCYTILIDRPYSASTSADARVPDLAAAVDLILALVTAGSH